MNIEALIRRILDENGGGCKLSLLWTEITNYILNSQGANSKLPSFDEVMNAINSIESVSTFPYLDRNMNREKLFVAYRA